MISVVIPAFDCADVIAMQLDALSRQTPRQAWEVVVADNGSTDRTQDVVSNFTGDLPDLRVVQAKRRGPSAARNAGAAAARGDVLVFTDADDIVASDWLRAIEKAFAGGARFVTGPIFGFETPALIPNPQPRISAEPLVHMDFLPYAFGTNLAVLADIFELSGGFDEDLRTAEDVEFSWRLQLAGEALFAEPSAQVFRRDAVDARETVKQCFGYGSSDPFLYRGYRDRGIPTPKLAANLRTYTGLVLRLPLLANQTQRRLWLRQIARRAGRLYGSLKAGVWYP